MASSALVRAILRFLDAERFWLIAAILAPRGRAEFREKWTRTRGRRLLTPAAIVTLPVGWRAVAIGSRGDGGCLFVHQLPDNGAANELAALLGLDGWINKIPTAASSITSCRELSIVQRGDDSPIVFIQHEMVCEAFDWNGRSAGCAGLGIEDADRRLASAKGKD
jgi:hypothetical protein